ncbi:hypothetical protein HNP84_006121 [Thermocatellispora tengchongensis]|uniref:FtsX-like permease family protein n=1 Tax=Thermocatellispora tengchongensis TaxID=1073253 RepID=A0A840P4Z4_9ACTN|nr:FtsX-like permease family protein [Thermocatellispora tengchongensis]MBB5136374.1 hypothetical protein [Thermocatellispora tengchongensis]
MSAVRLAWRLLAGGGRRGALGAGLTLAAVAVSTALLMFAVGVNFAFAERAERGAWRQPVAAAQGERAVAVQAVRQDFVRDRAITVVELAALADPPAPPGLARFPRPGEVWVSPALAELTRELPADQLGRRFPAAAAGTIGEDGLVHPDELVAVVGRATGDPALRVQRAEHDRLGIAPTRIAGFGGEATDEAITYRILAVIATVLMVVPLLVFGGAAARLTVARRDQRLAALRLVGATPGQVVAMTVAEAVVVAAVGAVAGVLVYAAALPGLAAIPIGGGGWYPADLWPGVLPVLAVLVAVPLLVGVSAVAGLRRVVVSPLGVARRETPPGLRVIRMVVFLALLVAFPVVVSAARGTAPAVGLAVVATLLALCFLGVNLVGPWVVALIGRVVARTARGPERLLAGRRLVDDPRSAWRTVAGVALTGFVAGFIGLLSPSTGLLGDAPRTRLSITAPAGDQAAAAREARERLEAAGVQARVEVRREGPQASLVAELPEKAPDAAIDRARTALAGLVPGRSATSPADQDALAAVVLGDIRTGTVVVLSVSFLVAIASAGITAASSVLDRRQTYALLRLAGTPLEVLDRARRAETLIPLAVMGGGAVATGVFCALPFATAGVSVTGAVVLVVCLVAGFAGVIGAGALSAPLLRSVTAEPAPRPD